MANSSFRNDKRTFKNARETGNTEDLYARKASVQMEEQKRQRAEAEQNAAQEHAQRQRGIFRNLMGGIKEGITGEIDRKRQNLYDSWGTMPNALGTVGRAMKNSVKYGGPAPKGTKNKKDESSNDGSSSAEMNSKFNKLDGELKKQNTLVTDSIRKIDGKLEDILLATNRIDANINKLIYMMNNMPRQNNNVPVLEQPQKEPQPRDSRTGRFLPRNGARPAPRPTPPQTTPRTSTMSRVGMGVGRALGTGMLGVGTGLAAYDEYTQSGNAGRAGFVGGGALAGMIAGGKLGAMGGAFAGLPGAFIGGIAGSAIGGIAGSSLGRSLYDSIGGERAPSIAGGLLSSTTTNTERNLRGAENQTEALRNAANEIRVETNMYNINVKDSVTITAGGKIEFKGSEIVFNSAKITNVSQSNSSQGGGSGGGVGGASPGSQSGSSAGSNGGSGGQSPGGSGPAQGQGGTNQGPFINGQLAGGIGPAPNFTTGTPSGQQGQGQSGQQGQNPNVGNNVAQTAARYEGFTRARNATDIRQFFRQNGVNLDPATAAWCAAFVNSALQSNGIRGSGSMVANSFQRWGQGVEANQVRAGDVVLQTRGRGADQVGGHVGIATGRVRDGQVEMTAGNTGRGSAVRTYWVPMDRNLMVRRATEGVPQPQQSPDGRQAQAQPGPQGQGGQGQAQGQGQQGQFEPLSPQEFARQNGFNYNNMPAGMRNNNPGNIIYTRRSNYPGMVGPSTNTDQGYNQVVFNSPRAGLSAMDNLVIRRFGQGRDTIQKLIADRGGWTPGNNRAAENIARMAGVGVNDRINLNDPEVRRRVLQAIIRQEHGPAGQVYNKLLDEHFRNRNGQGGSPHPVHGANRVRGGGQGQTPAPQGPQGGSQNDSNTDGKIPPVQGFGNDANANGAIPNLNNPALSQPPKPVPGGSAQPGPLLNDAESRRGRAFNQTRVPYQDQVPPDLKMIEAEREMRRVGLLGDNEAQRGRAFNQVNSGAPRFAPMPVPSPVDRRGPETDDLVARLQAEEWKKAQESRVLMEHAERQAAIVNEVNQTGSLINQRATDQAIAQSRQGSNVNVVQSSEPPRATTPSLGNDGNTPARATPSGQFAEEIESKSSGPLVEAPERNQVGIHRMGSRYTQ